MIDIQKESDELLESIADEKWINIRMQKVADSQGSPDELEEILLKDMTHNEIRAFCLGVRAGKHNAALTFLNESASTARELARKIDEYMK